MNKFEYIHYLERNQNPLARLDTLRHIHTFPWGRGVLVMYDLQQQLPDDDRPPLTVLKCVVFEGQEDDLHFIESSGFGVEETPPYQTAIQFGYSIASSDARDSVALVFGRILNQTVTTLEATLSHGGTVSVLVVHGCFALAEAGASGVTHVRALDATAQEVQRYNLP